MECRPRQARVAMACVAPHAIVSHFEAGIPPADAEAAPADTEQRTEERMVVAWIQCETHEMDSVA